MISTSTSLYCGFNGDAIASTNINNEERTRDDNSGGGIVHRTANITWISPTGDILHTARGLSGKACNDTRLLLDTAKAAEGLYTCIVQFTDAVYHLFIGVYRTEFEGEQWSLCSVLK